jgi:hypothetical protein
MPPIVTGLHINAVTLGTSFRVCAIWRVGGVAEPERRCAFPRALLLPRRGTEQDWAVDSALIAVEEQRIGDGSLCVDLATTLDGITVTGLRPGLCGSELLELSRAALGEGHEEWAERARRDPRTFHAVAAGHYVLLRHAAAVADRDPARPGGRALIVHEREHPVLRAYIAALLTRTRKDTEC